MFLYFCLEKPGILHGFTRWPQRKAPFPLSLPPSYLPTVAAVGNILADLTRRPIHTHTLPKIQPNPYSAACKEPCQRVLPLRDRTLLSVGFTAAHTVRPVNAVGAQLFSNRLLSFSREICERTCTTVASNSSSCMTEKRLWFS